MIPPMSPEAWVANNHDRDPWSLLVELGEHMKNGCDKGWIAHAMDLAAGLPWPVSMWHTMRCDADDADTPVWIQRQKAKKNRPRQRDRDVAVSDKVAVAA